ncbi:TIGR04219 family outer membrane beta-barrel protein [Paraferrimonas sp. SM1919]|uniref:TIGR04219 family outer membrane beta-barrel protein n=1 Tax=Paraferrimonas sp. SM1919 TaxID=2662263 RepID=UPI002110E3B5|nr:TIGR04219 family outer membrane beta-barrel protein [Paraferrimonas sp. SM1919]
MKHLKLSALVIGATMATSVNADSLSFKVGLDAWNPQSNLAFGEVPNLGNPDATLQAFNTDKKWSGTAYLAVEHFIPLIPNFMIRQNEIEVAGSALVNNWKFADYPFVNQNVAADMDASSTDIVLYYELIDKVLGLGIFEVDLGVNYRKYKGALRATPIGGVDDGRRVERSFTDGVIMGYVAAKAHIPGIGLYGFVDGYVGANAGTHTDYQVGLGWAFTEDEDLKVKVGYRNMKIDSNDLSKLRLNTELDGVFAGIELRL